jgi:mono/diheme cytochrome c family protein
MARLTVALAFGWVAALALAQTAAGAPPVALQTLSVELPAGDRPFPPGPNLGVVSANCATCHSSGMILNQPNLPVAAWQGEVTKMINVYKAPIDPADVPAIVAYLAAVKGG